MLFVDRGNRTRIQIPYDIEMAGDAAVEQYIASPPQDAMIIPYDQESMPTEVVTEQERASADAVPAASAPKRGRSTSTSQES